MNTLRTRYLWICSLSLLSISVLFSTANGSDNDVKIERALWNDKYKQLQVNGTGKSGDTVILSSAKTQLPLTTTRIDSNGRWNVSLSQLTSIPCRVRSETNRSDDEAEVKNAPQNCDQLSGTPSEPPSSVADYTVLAANDLGMHCADLDYQIFSILPPFNVVHAQVIQRGTDNDEPRLLDNTSVEVFYNATSSPVDPAGAYSITTTSQNLPGIYKSNFWEKINATTTYAGATYGTLYPSVLAVDPTNTCKATYNCPSALSLFDPIAVNVGIPVPDPKALYPLTGVGALVIDQQAMPGLANTPQAFDRYDADLPFFVNFPFGSRISNVNWFAADGIPILPIDDKGRQNPYPLMKIAAHNKVSGLQLASVDVVLPVASEADCQNCHVQPLDCLDPDLPQNVQSDSCTGSAVAQTAFNVITLDDNPPGATRLEQLLNTAKINILRLHDTKHGANYKNWDTTGTLTTAGCDPLDANDPNCLINQTPIQCSRCHYSPALDLAQVGPINEAEQGVNGRQQTVHISMSRAMHGHHGALPPFENKALFPDMPLPINRTDAQAQQVLGETCYQCHPGKRTKCLRGAMFSGGVVCQDCHGNMQQVGNDFTGNLPDTPFPAGADLSKRVPWASEPGCQSCHTGDALSNLAGQTGTIPDDPHGIRLKLAYLQGDPDATPLVATNKRFAEDQSLYRLSKGHGGVMCEGCHGNTHSIWPNQNAFANDNVTSNQLQGHSGTIIECDTCHAPGSLGLTLDGPHGMHPVGDPEWTKDHESLAEDKPDRCRACHGKTGEGTVLSRMAATRTLECEEGLGCQNKVITLEKGSIVTCTTCHENELTH